jgi:hypothetical protein
MEAMLMENMGTATASLVVDGADCNEMTTRKVEQARGGTGWRARTLQRCVDGDIVVSALEVATLLDVSSSC